MSFTPPTGANAGFSRDGHASTNWAMQNSNLVWLAIAAIAAVLLFKVVK